MRPRMSTNDWSGKGLPNGHGLLKSWSEVGREWEGSKTRRTDLAGISTGKIPALLCGPSRVGGGKT